MNRTLATRTVKTIQTAAAGLTECVDSVVRVEPAPRCRRWQVWRSDHLGGGVEYFATRREALAALAR